MSKRVCLGAVSVILATVCILLLISTKSESNPITVEYLGIDGVDRFGPLESDENICISNRTDKTYFITYHVDFKRNGVWDTMSMGFVGQIDLFGPHSSRNWGPFPKLDAKTYPNEPWRFRVVASEQLTGYRATIEWVKFYGRRLRLGLNPFGPYRSRIENVKVPRLR